MKKKTKQNKNNKTKPTKIKAFFKSKEIVKAGKEMNKYSKSV